ncbi:MAG: PSD1 and planctomycete cytochrome C domain-containing protein [Pirellulaceae bacterium]
MILRLTLLLFIVLSSHLHAEEVDFNRDVRPILSDKCFACHGPDQNKREADLRLDTHDGLLGEASGASIVVPGDIEKSELWQRISTDDESLRMPPADSQKSLAPPELDTLRRWIKSGATWQGHWSYQPLTSPLPLDHSPTMGAIDAFVARELQQHGLTPSAPAAAHTLVRRLSFDLVGLPPDPTVVDQFIRDPSEQAYEQLVDTFMSSPHFGERMAMWWLDLVRYADTVGYHGDQEMNVYPFRRYVIDAFNANKPFDEFTIEQMAGDLLPDPTQEQRIASGYNRLGMMSAEGGVQDKEYLAKYIAERVRNLGGTWLGSTLGCCECHSHKYDPFTIGDFYRFEAFFADIKEKGLYSGANSTGDWGSWMFVENDEQQTQHRHLRDAIAVAQERLAAPNEQLDSALEAWATRQHRALVLAVRSQEDSADESSMPPTNFADERTETPPSPADTNADDPEALTLDKLPEEIKQILRRPFSDRDETQQKQLITLFRQHSPLWEEARQQLKQAEASLQQFEANLDRTLITETVSPRTIRILARGNWMDESGEVVAPGIPEFLGASRLPQTADGERLDRLDLAKWVVSPQNPLTARTLANRLWALYFGTGLSAKLDDLGSQGQWPSHPELLDYLASDIVQSGWDIKRAIKQIVMSRTYRQSSHPSDSQLQHDPDNRYLSRQNSYRLTAELVRDNALSVSGLLDPTIGGPSVHPYQPPGYWAYLNFPTRQWQNDSGSKLYRRGLYVHWQRQYLHPSLLAFDAPNREECTAQRARSNTPLQSLVLLNDPIYVEAARALATRLLAETDSPTDDQQSVRWLYRQVLSRSATEAEATVLERMIDRQRQHYRKHLDDAKKLLEVGDFDVPSEVNRGDLAAWTNVCRAILGLHETITRY